MKTCKVIFDVMLKTFNLTISIDAKTKGQNIYNKNNRRTDQESHREWRSRRRRVINVRQWKSSLSGRFFQKISEHLNPKNEFLYQRPKKNASTELWRCLVPATTWLSANIPLKIEWKPSQKNETTLYRQQLYIEQSLYTGNSCDNPGQVRFPSTALYITALSGHSRVKTEEVTAEQR